jgi:hypothetical protein
MDATKYGFGMENAPTQVSDRTLADLCSLRDGQLRKLVNALPPSASEVRPRAPFAWLGASSMKTGALLPVPFAHNWPPASQASLLATEGWID